MKKLALLFMLNISIVSCYAMEVEYQVAVGNKTFGKNDFKNLSGEQKDDLIAMSKPPCILGLCGVNNKVLTPENVEKLRNMPVHIKKDMATARCSTCDRVYNDQRVSYCTNGTMCCGAIGICGTGWVWTFIKCNMSTRALAALSGGCLGVSAIPCMVCGIYTGAELCCCRDIREVKL
ncbi:MAG TPA: hypothetical protein VJJ26_00780 [Candidatus Babeliales bacterium]|nr:hypothetical protein [Candidatus Babeliales bacterium]